MSEPEPPDERFIAEVGRQAERARRGRHLGFWEGLSLAGAVGWMVSLPSVLGALLGRWLDGRAGAGISWTLTLLLLGLAAGCASAWRYVRRELRR